MNPPSFAPDSGYSEHVAEREQTLQLASEIAALWLRHGEEAPVLAQHRNRSFSRWDKDGGTIVLRFELPAEEAVPVLKALEAAAQEVVEEERAAEAARESECRNADGTRSDQRSGPAGPLFEAAGSSRSAHGESAVRAHERGGYITKWNNEGGPAGPFSEDAADENPDDEQDAWSAWPPATWTAPSRRGPWPRSFSSTCTWI